jgi:hypothetical protein
MIVEMYKFMKKHVAIPSALTDAADVSGSSTKYKKSSDSNPKDKL